MLGPLDSLQNAATYRVLRKSLNWTAMGTALIGSMLILIVGPYEQVGTPAIILGSILVAEALWTFIAARPFAIIVNGVFLGLIGLGGGIILDTAYSVPGRRGLGVTAGLMLGIWGLGTTVRYKRFKIAHANLDPLSMTRVDEMVGALENANIADDTECIKFVVENSAGLRELVLYFLQRPGAASRLSHEWKGRLFGDAVLLMDGDILLLLRADFNLEGKGPVPAPDAKPESRVNLTVEFGGQRFESGSMELRYVQRYLAWKGAGLEAQAGT